VGGPEPRTQNPDPRTQNPNPLEMMMMTQGPGRAPNGYPIGTGSVAG